MLTLHRGGRGVHDRTIPDTSSLAAQPAVPEACQKQWHVLRVKAQRELNVKRLLGIIGFEAYVPTYRTADRQNRLRVLLPGYVLCQFAYTDRVGVIRIPGLIDSDPILKFGDEPAVVQDTELRCLRNLESAGATPTQLDSLPEGATVFVHAGGGITLYGVVEKTGAQRILVKLEMFGRIVSANFDRSQLQAA